jgi:hypothetical protein
MAKHTLRGIDQQQKAKERAECLRSVFERLSSLSAKKAAEELNARGIPAPLRGRRSATQVIRESSEIGAVGGGSSAHPDRRRHRTLRYKWPRPRQGGTPQARRPCGPDREPRERKCSRGLRRHRGLTAWRLDEDHKPFVLRSGPYRRASKQPGPERLVVWCGGGG